MFNIRITETPKKTFAVTVDEFPDIRFTSKTYEDARDKAVELTKAEIAKDIIPVIEEEFEPSRVSFGFAA